MQDNDSTTGREPNHCVTWTVRETAEQLGITPSTAYTYVDSGLIPAVKLGHRLLIPRPAVLALVEKAVREWGGPDAP